MTHSESNHTHQPGRKIRPAKVYESVLKSALWHLSQRDMTVGELRIRLERKTTDVQWVNDAIAYVTEMGYLHSDEVFARRYAEQAFSGEYGSQYILDKLQQKGISKDVILTVVATLKLERNIDEQMILNNRLNTYYPCFNIPKGKLETQLRKRGFNSNQIRDAIQQHPCKDELLTDLEFKASKLDIENELIKLSKKGKGRSLILQELRSRKVDMAEATVQLDRLTQNGTIDFFDSCCRALAKKTFDLNDYKSKNKAYAWLQAKGFAGDEIRHAMDEANGDQLR